MNKFKVALSKVEFHVVNRLLYSQETSVEARIYSHEISSCLEVVSLKW
ncbi:hypothetical protein SAMN05421579_101137 [Xenorhabdus japonica]|uniref:Uncharacterized protein n=1 Tax=Xenorhabdus japonica TaxID=53341 RepID=A0A1I4YB76_9GAMM|nr:hypothetical protein SAMN05421579_101137 [Xenorhabdus japonica]